MPKSQGRGETQTEKVYKLSTNAQIKRLESICNAIHKVLNGLNDNQYAFYVLYFEKGLSKIKVCMEMPISESTYDRYKKKIVYKLAEELGFI